MTKAEVKNIISECTPISNIMAITRLGNYHEVVGRVGGDMLVYRVYDNGTITER